MRLVRLRLGNQIAHAGSFYREPFHMKGMTLTETLIVITIAMVLTIGVISASFKAFEVINAWRIDYFFEQRVPMEGIKDRALLDL